MDSGNIAIFYSLGRLYESSGQIDEAKEIFSRVLENDVTYEDVQDRYRKLKGAVAPGRLGSPSIPNLNTLRCRSLVCPCGRPRLSPAHPHCIHPPASRRSDRRSACWRRP